MLFLGLYVPGPGILSRFPAPNLLEEGGLNIGAPEFEILDKTYFPLVLMLGKAS